MSPAATVAWALLKAIYTHIIEKGKGVLLLAIRERTAIAGILVVDSDMGSHYLFAASKSDSLKYCPNDFLIHLAIKRTADKGLNYFDFLPSGMTHPNLMQFKRKWGSESCSVPVYSLVTKPLAMGLWNIAYHFAETSFARSIVSVLRKSK